MWVLENMMSLALEYSTQRLRDSISIGLSFQRLSLQSILAWKRFSCSSSLIENQYFSSRIPSWTIIRSN